MNVFATGWSDGFDGPGRRWVVYLKGCNFRCRWCASPESIKSQCQLLFYARRGLHPDRACTHGAVARKNGAWTLRRKCCANCPDRACTTVWKHPAFEWAGEPLGVADLVAHARRCRPLFGTSGGVTFGGGEATLQADELAEALAQLRRGAIHTVVETNASTPGFAAVLDKADLLICDLKCVSARMHREWTGAGNEAVLANLRQAAETPCRLLIRVPLVPGMNDSEEEAARMTEFLASLPMREPALTVEILRMHHMGEPKYEALGLPYPMAGTASPSTEQADRLAARMWQAGIAARVA